MASNSSLNITSLDFDTLKNSFKTYMQSQTIFKDYDFEGSNINVLMGLLAYNTYLNSFYLNMVASESFLDTAQLRDSVISHAKAINYTPTSTKSPKALIDVVFNTTGITGGTFEIPKGTMFSTTNSNGSFSFVTDKNTVITSGNNIFSLVGLEVYEGSYINETFLVDDSVEAQKYVLSNPNIDTDSLNVSVIEDNNLFSTDYILARNLYDVGPLSTVFYLQAFKDQYEIVFGDGIFGKKPKNNSTILATYRVTNGTAGGGCQTFICDKDLGTYNGGFASINISINTPASAGAAAESIESIRYRAPRYYQTQDRAITKNDYKTLLLDQFTEIKSVNVYGGESITDSYGVEYGKVYISAITYAGSYLSVNRKADILSFLKDKMTIGLTPIIINPDILYLTYNSNILYDVKKTAYSPSDIKSLALGAMRTFNDNYLKDFDTAFRYSQLVDTIQNFDNSIISNTLTTKIVKISSPLLFKSQSFDITFNNPIVPGTLSSTGFLVDDGFTYSLTDYNVNNDTFVRTPTADGYIIKNTSNILYLKLSDPTKQTFIPIGTINYDTGALSVSQLTVIDYLGGVGIEVSVKTVNDDIFASKNDLIEIDFSKVNINVTAV